MIICWIAHSHLSQLMTLKLECCITIVPLSLREGDQYKVLCGLVYVCSGGRLYCLTNRVCEALCCGLRVMPMTDLRKKLRK